MTLSLGRLSENEQIKLNQHITRAEPAELRSALRFALGYRTTFHGDREFGRLLTKAVWYVNARRSLSPSKLSTAAFDRGKVSAT